MSLEHDLLEDEVLLTNTTEFDYMGVHYTVESFAEQYSIALDQAHQVIEILVQQGKIVFGTKQEIADKDVLKALKQAGIFSNAQDVLDDESSDLNYRKQKARVGRHVYGQVEFEFGNMKDLKAFKQSVMNLRLESEKVVDDERECFILRVFDLSDKELTNLSRIYKTNNFVKTAVTKTNNAFDGALKATDYTAKNVLVPVTKIGISGMLNIGKSLVGTVAKVGSIAVTETMRTTRDTVNTIKEDDAMLVARAELNRTKNEISHKINTRKGISGGNGIKIG